MTTNRYKRRNYDHDDFGCVKTLQPRVNNLIIHFCEGTLD